MDRSRFLVYLLVMAGVTYLIRMLPLAAIRGRVRSVFLQSFLYYVPYAVLGAMTFPAVFSATGSWFSALAGTLAAAEGVKPFCTPGMPSALRPAPSPRPAASPP